MANIENVIDPDNDLTIHVVHGDLTAEDIIQTADERIIENPTRFVIWNLLHGSFSKLSNNDLMEISMAMEMLVKKSKLSDTKVAIVVAEDFDYGIGRMYESQTDIPKENLGYMVFRSIEEAKNWMGLEV